MYNKTLEFLVANTNAWSGVFILLCLELSVCSFIIFPVPASLRRSVLESIANVWNKSPRIRICVWMTQLLIATLFMDSIRNLYSIHLAFKNMDPLTQIGGQPNIELNQNIYQAQRNMFLCGSTLFMFMVVYRFQSMADKLRDMELSADPEFMNRSELHLKKQYGLGTDKVKFEAETPSGQTKVEVKKEM
eukprot:TRINITY_DN22131_c0_g1_i1.p1 TRINITY_DN22131_c0_g1~~TRINITY_DN22131_c0_g1_i1.p1  ORF type:complete len:189 (-),score=46.21 TRINITY_DN22131_c0_g1_i1:72-638(-)